MSKIDNGGSAFPLHIPGGDTRYDYTHDGMTLRDWFAGQALGAIVSTFLAETIRAGKMDMATADTVAPSAYEFADAMLAARKEASK